MQAVGIICEYNPFHLGHYHHIAKTKEILGNDTNVICVMSGNFVQRGDFAILNKHARAKMAVMCGADVVIELPTPYVLSSAREFAKAGVYLLDALGICNYISFGSESGRIRQLLRAARAIVSKDAEECLRDGISRGLSYAAAQQLAADALLGENADIFRLPNNTLAIEYIKALSDIGSGIRPMTIKRFGGEHDGDTGYSASFIRQKIASGTVPMDMMPGAAVAVCMEEFMHGRGPVLLDNMAQAILSRLRMTDNFSNILGATDGLDGRFLRCASAAPTIDSLLDDVKTKRFAMSRVRRVMMCATLGITSEYLNAPPPYIRILAMNSRGMTVLRAAGDMSKLPILIKPASVNMLDACAVDMFNLESRVTDFYSLAYENSDERTGGNEWRTSPLVVE